jgi:hypothetical protein
MAFPPLVCRSDPAGAFNLKRAAAALRLAGSFFQNPIKLNVASRTQENLSDDDFVNTYVLVTAMAVIKTAKALGLLAIAEEMIA